MLHSTHSFMLPLKWDYLPASFTKENGKYAHDFAQRSDLRSVNQMLLKSGWARPFYKINQDVDRYNEMTYFHAYATSTLFDLQQRSESTPEAVDNGKMMSYYEIEPTSDDDAYFNIKLSNNKKYKLKLTGISIHLYFTGILILTFNLENHKYHESEEILQINEFGRRIYPQFLTKQHPSQYTKSAKSAFLAESIELCCKKINNGIPVFENFSDYDNLINKEVHSSINGKYIENTIISLPQHIQCLFSNDFVFNALTEDREKVRLNLIGDDRMFFQCWYGNREVSDFLKESDQYLTSDFWYAFMFGDKTSQSVSIANPKMQKLHTDDQTYQRWASYGTFYGFTRDSFVSVSVDKDYLDKNNIPPTYTHMKTMYYHMAVLSLAQRASVLKFSAEVSGLSKLGKHNKDKASRLIQSLYLSYIEFINKIYFREISPQIQGIEMYTQFQKVMNIEKDLKDLATEISELYNFSMLVKQDKLTRIATFFIPFSVVFGILGANMFDTKHFNFSSHVDWDAVMWLVIGIAISFIGAMAILFWETIKNYTIKLIWKIQQQLH